MRGPTLALVVRGEPGPQGSKRVVGGHTIESSAKVKPWRQAVVSAVSDALGDALPDGEQPWRPGRDQAIYLRATFTMGRPRSHYRADGETLKSGAPSEPFTRPDLDKLARSTLDGLKDGGALVDDSRVVVLLATKCYPGGDVDALDAPGAVLLLRYWGGDA